jgi:diaminopimelate decarboxylase
MDPLVGGRGQGCQIFYSYKTNPVPEVLGIMHQSGIGAEVISPFELWLALALGVPGEKLIYNGPAKSTPSLRDAIQAGALLINANSLGEVKRIDEIANESDHIANLGIRVTLPGMWGGQFGLHHAADVIEAVRMGVSSANVAMRGLHFHRGATMRTAEQFASYVEGVLEYCDLLREATGWSPSILDLGGSLACPTVAPVSRLQFRLNRALGSDLLPPDPSRCLLVGEASTMAWERIHEHFSALGVPDPVVVLEPGRALTGNTQLLLTSVLDVKPDDRLSYAILDAGINIAEPVTSEYHHLFDVTRPCDDSEHHYRLAGPICTPADVLYNDWRLPLLEPGRVLAIMDTGAYCVPFSTAFSFPRPSIVMLERGEVRELRSGETFADLVSLDTCFKSGRHP